MTNRHTDDGAAEHTGKLNRRSVLKMAGAAAAVTGTGMVGKVGAAQSDGPQVDQVVNLGKEGLSDGDTIDSYLDDHLDDGVEVRIPEGEYGWEGTGFGGSVSNAAVIGEGEVILNTVEGEYNPTIKAEDGVVQFKNMTVRGKVEDSRIRFQADDGARILVENWNFPDGTDGDGGDSRPFYVPGEHAGEVEFRNCYMKRFDDNGIYASSPGKDYGKGGRVVIDGCFAHNCDVASYRLGGTNSVVRNSVVLNDARAPATVSGGIEQRGIRLENNDKSKDMLVKNCDIIHTHTNEDESSNPITFKEADGSTGHIENVRIRNDTPHEAIEDDEALSGWTGNNISVTGSGNMFVPDKFTNVCIGDGCTEPSRETDAIDGSDGTGGSDGSDGTGGSDGSDGTAGSDGSSTEPTKKLVIEASADNPDTYLDVSVTVDGRIDYGPEAESDGDEIDQNEDGTYTATSIEMDPGAVDSYRVRGEVQDVSYTDGYDVTITLDGEEISTDQLPEGGSSSDGSSGDGSSGDGSSGDRLSKRVIVDGTGSDELSRYTIVVSGDVEVDQSVSTAPDATPWDQFDDHIDGNKIIGTVDKGIDGYRYSGEITDLEIDGDVSLTVENGA